MICDLKQQHYDKIIEKLRSNTLSTIDWWSTLKTFIISCTKSSFPPLELNNDIYTDESDKANILNTFFHSQTVLNEMSAALPNLPDNPLLNSHLDNITLSELEVESVIKTLVIGKASGPNGLSNRILRELSSELAVPFCSLFNQSLRLGTFPGSYLSWVVLKRVICLLSPIIDLYPCLTVKVNFLKDSFSNIYLIIYKIITCSLPYSLALDRETQLLIY